MAVEPVQVEYAFSLMRKKDIQVSRLQRDGFLFVEGDPEEWIQSNPADLLSVRFLELRFVENIGDSIGQLSNLKHLFIYGQNLKFLPNSISSLPNLQRLELDCCFNLQELPANLGDFNSLTFLSLDNCNSIKSLPNSISKLSNLTSLHLLFCKSLKELPAISNVVELELCGFDNIQSLPKGLCNLKKLHLYNCKSLTELPTDLNLLQLKIEYCCSIQSLPKILTNLQLLHLPLCSKMLSLVNLIYFRSLWHLTFDNHCSCGAHLKELPPSLWELSELLTLNIQGTTIKWLPWSITELSKLRLLSLPEHFRLETLPEHLNDSIVISVEDTHIRKTWQQLKTEIQLFGIPIVGVEGTHCPSTPGYLQFRMDPGPWIQSNNLHSVVRVLDLDLQDLEFDSNIIHFMGKLPELTRLYISDGYLLNLPLTLTRLTHLSLVDCNFVSCCDSLGKLSTLQSLTLSNCRALPGHLDLPVSLTHFALEYCEFDSIPDSYMASMRKLSNMKTLNLSGFEDLELSLLSMNLTKLRVVNCNIKSLPICLQHLEIIHSGDMCLRHGRCRVDLQVCLSQVVDLETLSVTCYDIEVLPSLARHQTLQELQLKDCFNLRKLPPNLNELVKLCTLNVSGTTIKSLPDSITKLQNLRHLTIPKCFTRKSLLKNFKEKVGVIVDDTDDVYYQHEQYYDLAYVSSEDDEIAFGSTEGGHDLVSEEFRQDSVIEQASSHSFLNPLPDATQVHEGSYFSSRTVPIYNGLPSSQNLEMEILPAVIEKCVVPLAPNNISSFIETDGHCLPINIWQDHADPTELEDSPFDGTANAIGKSSSYARCYVQNQELEISAVREFGEGSRIREFGEGSRIREFGECSRIREFDESSRYGFQIKQIHNPRSDNVKYNKTRKKEIPREWIETLMSQNMRQEDAVKQLDVSRPTLRRLLNEYGLNWPSSRKRKQPQDAKSKKQNTKSPRVGKDSSLLNLVDPANLAGHNLLGEQCLEMLDQLALTERTCDVPSDVNAAKGLNRDLDIGQNHNPRSDNVKDNKTRKKEIPLDCTLRLMSQNMRRVDAAKQLDVLSSTSKRILEVNAAHESVRAVSRRIAQDQPPSIVGACVKENSSVAEGGASLDSIQQPKSSSIFIVKAEYSGDIIKFDLPLSSSIDQLKEELSKRLNLDIGKIKMKYKDEENDWILMNLMSDLERALCISYSCGSSALKLLITTSKT